jgi:hypothetical protein
MSCSYWKTSELFAISPKRWFGRSTARCARCGIARIRRALARAFESVSNKNCQMARSRQAPAPGLCLLARQGQAGVAVLRPYGETWNRVAVISGRCFGRGTTCRARCGIARIRHPLVCASESVSINSRHMVQRGQASAPGTACCAPTEPFAFTRNHSMATEDWPRAMALARRPPRASDGKPKVQRTK